MGEQGWREGADALAEAVRGALAAGTVTEAARMEAALSAYEASPSLETADEVGEMTLELFVHGDSTDATGRVDDALRAYASLRNAEPDVEEYH